MPDGVSGRDRRAPARPRGPTRRKRTSSRSRPEVTPAPLDEVEAGEEKTVEPAVDDIDVEDDSADAPDDPFLEEEEEDDDDVSTLIDGDIAPDEEVEAGSGRGAGGAWRGG